MTNHPFCHRRVSQRPQNTVSPALPLKGLRPQTFSMAEKLVEEFNDLNDAHQSVVTAREQTEILRRAR